MTNLKAWKDLWRTIRQVYDSDKNGFVGIEELEEMFRKFYPKQLEGKALNLLFKKFVSAYDKSLLNYKKFREDLGSIISNKLNAIKLQTEKSALHTEDNLNSPFKKKHNLNTENLGRLHELKKAGD